MTSDPPLDWLISVDDHVIEPPNLWVDRVPAKDRDRAPRMVRDGDDEYWLYEDKRMPTLGPERGRRASRRRSSAPSRCRYDEMRPGCYDPVARLEDMDRAGMLASLCFPSLPRFCGQLFYEAERPRARLRLPAGLQRLDDRRVVRRRARSLHPARRSSRSGTRRSRPRRWSAARRRARPRSRSPRTPRRSACPRSTTPTATGTR